jgi:hypothetical protein
MKHFVALQTRLVRVVAVGVSAASVLLADELPLAAGDLRTDFASPNAAFSQPLMVSVPHRLSRAEALRRVKSGLASIKANYGLLFAMQEETWIGYRLSFHVSVLGQAVYGTIDVRDHFVSLRAILPWLLAGLAEAAVPVIRKQGALILARK